MDVVDLHSGQLSGGVILAIVQREELYNGSDLDLYMPKDAAMCLRNYLEVFEGYTLAPPRTRQEGQDYQLVISVDHLHRMQREDGKCIDVIETIYQVRITIRNVFVCS